MRPVNRILPALLYCGRAMGFGRSSRLHTSKILRLSNDLPLVVEINDSEKKTRALLPLIEKMVGGGLITLEKVQVLKYSSQVS